MLRLLSFVLFSVLMLIPNVCQAQFPAPTTPAPKVDQATEKKAFDLIESLSEQVGNLHSPSNRLRAQCAVADLLWTRDQKRARGIFLAAVMGLKTRISELDYSDQDVYQEIQLISQSRQDLLTRIAAHDPELAIKSLKETRLNADANGRQMPNWNLHNEANLEMSIANLLAAKDPAAAVSLARSTLARGVSWQVINFVPQLYQKDQKLAGAFYQEVVSRIKDEDISRTPDLANTAWNLLSMVQPPQADENTFRDLMTVFLGHMLAANRQTQAGINLIQNFYPQVEQMAPLVEKYAPSRVGELREWARSVEPSVDPSVRMYQQIQQLNQNGTVDEILTLAAKYPPEYQGMLYQSAAWKAVNNGQLARAKEIAELMTDPIQRRHTLNALEDQAATAAEGQNRMITARRQANRARNLTQKIEILARTAEVLASEGDKKGALDLLNEAKTILAASQSAGQVQSRLRIAQAYCRFDAEQSFAMLQPLIGTVNGLIAAAWLLDGIEFQNFKEGEWVMPGRNNMGIIVTTLSQTLAGLGQTDFDRARTLADQIERPEIRMLVEIELAQTALGERARGVPAFVGQGFRTSKIN